MEATKEDALPKSVIVDREGDVILLLEDHEIQVSSKVLGLASPIFKAMFSSTFAEGRSLTSSSPFRISLTDDNLMAMVSLCRIIHYQTKLLPNKPDQSFVEQLAIVADKYDCIEALRPLSHMWLATLEAEAVVLIENATTSTIGKLLYSAYTFDCAIAFKKITRSMIFYVGVNTLLDPMEPYQISSATQALLPEGLLEALRSEENNDKEYLRNEVEKMMSVLISDSDLHNGRHTEECMSIKHLLTWMIKADLWPLSQALSSSTIFELCSKLTDYPTTIRCTSYLQVCPLCRDRIADQIKKLAFQMGSSTSWVCLDCFKRGGSEKKGDDCRVKHL